LEWRVSYVARDRQNESVHIEHLILQLVLVTLAGQVEEVEIERSSGHNVCCLYRVANAAGALTLQALQVELMIKFNRRRATHCPSASPPAFCVVANVGWYLTTSEFQS
jgi:hypothetical protein